MIKYAYKSWAMHIIYSPVSYVKKWLIIWKFGWRAANLGVEPFLVVESIEPFRQPDLGGGTWSKWHINGTDGTIFYLSP